MQVNAQQDLQNQVEAQKASLGKTKSCLTTTFVKLDSDDACNDEHDSSMDKGRDNLLHEGRKMKILEPKIDKDQLCEDAYEVFKNEICEDIMKIDCIQELAIDCVDMDTLPEDPDMIILSFCDERKESFEFYFKSREDMASIVGVGMLHAKVTLEGGEITITEIMEEDWNQKWGSVARNSKGNVKLFKIKRAFPSGVREGLTHLNVEISTRKPFLWELAKYFSLKECIATFASKEMYAKCANGGEASSSSSSNNEVQQSYIIAGWNWVVKNIIVRKSSDENGGSVSNQSQERVMECSKSTATTVKLQLLSGGCIKKLEGMESCIGQIVPNLEFTFTNEGEGKKSIQIVVGEISFQFTRSENGDQGNWYHTKFRVIFGLLNANIQRYGLFERQTLKNLNMSSGNHDKKTSCIQEDRKGNESERSVGGSLHVSVPPFRVIGNGSTALKNTSQAGEIKSEEESHGRTCEYTRGGLSVINHVEDHRIICDYYIPKSSTPRLEPIPSQEYTNQGVKFEGTWIPLESSPELVEYTLRASRDLRMAMSNEDIHMQEYETKILVNHSMSHLDGKTYKIRVWKNLDDGKELLTELSRYTKWPSDLLKLPDS